MLNRNNLEKIYFAVIEWGIYLSLFTPLIFIKTYFFPFVVPKTIFFRIIVDIIFIAYILLVISNPKYRPRITSLTATIAVFLALIVLTSFTGVNFERSFWSTFERMTGLLTFFHLFVFYIILTSCFKERKYWERILSVSILVCLFISFLVLTSEDPVTRGGGTLGNSSFFSAYNLFNIFFAIILIIMRPGVWRVFYGLSLILFLSVLLFNPGGFTKGAVAAFAIGMFILILGSLIFYLWSSGRKKLKNIAFLILIFSFLGLLGFSQLNFTKEKISQVWQSGSIQSRLVVWSTAWRGWQEKPWLGWGPENFNIPFAKYFDPKLPLTYDIWYDRVHNIVLDTGISSGIVGLISYLSIFIVAIFELLKLLPKIADRKNIFIPLGMAVLLLVYFFQNIWVFDMISSYAVFFLSLAFINFLIFSQKEETDKKVIPVPLFAGALLIIIAVIVFYFGNVQPARASKFTLYGISFPLEKSLVYFQKALFVSPMARFETPEQITTKITGLAFQGNQNKELLEKGFKLAEDELKNTIVENPLDFRSLLFLGRFYNNFYQFSGDKEKLVLAEKTLEEAQKFSPKNQQVYWALGQTKLFEGKTEEAVELLKTAVDLEPRFDQSHWYLFLTYKIAGKYDLALSELKEAENLGFNWKKDTNSLKQGIEAFRKTGSGGNVLIPLFEKGAELDPKDAYFWANLADVYSSTGEREKAKKAAEKLLELKPDLAPQIKDFLKGLGY